MPSYIYAVILGVRHRSITALQFAQMGIASEEVPDIELNMSGVGTSIDESGTLLHERARYVLRRDAGVGTMSVAERSRTGGF